MCHGHGSWLLWVFLCLVICFDSTSSEMTCAFSCSPCQHGLAGTRGDRQARPAPLRRARQEPGQRLQAPSYGYRATVRQLASQPEQHPDRASRQVTSSPDAFLCATHFLLIDGTRIVERHLLEQNIDTALRLKQIFASSWKNT